MSHTQEHRSPVNKKDFITKRAKLGMGLGLYAGRDFKKGEYLLDYVGNRIPTSVADDMPSRYLFELDKEWTIDGSPRWNTARYINHSCNPNVEADVVDGRIIITALRPIHAGDEFLIDYGEEYFDEFIKPSGCLCGAVSCRAPQKSAQAEPTKSAEKKTKAVTAAVV